MAIKFTFTLNDIDAANLFDIIHSEKARVLECVMTEMVGDNRPATIVWYKEHAAYIGRIADRMRSCQEKVPDSTGFSLEEPTQPPKDTPGEPLFDE